MLVQMEKYIAVEIAKFIICTTAPCQPLSKNPAIIGGVVHGTWTALKGDMKPMLIEKYVTNNAIKGTNTNGTSKIWIKYNWQTKDKRFIYIK